MSKMNELSQVLDDLISCGEKMIATANALKEMFTDTADTAAVPAEPVQPEAAPAEEEKPAQPEKEPVKYSFTDVRKAFADKSHAGFTAQVKELISKYGASRLSDVKEEDYPALMADLEVIG